MDTLFKRLHRWCLIMTVLGIWTPFSFALNDRQFVSHTADSEKFCLAQDGDLAVLYVDADDDPGVRRAAGDLQADILRVTGHAPQLIDTQTETGKRTVLIGTLGKSPLIDGLVRDGKLDVHPIKGQWESYIIQTLHNPLPGVDAALVIVGSDKRGAIYGIYDLSEQIGVSPWYWWADVPVKKSPSLYVVPGRFVQGPPAVQYRGIFLNDEAPALTNWVLENYGNYNHEFYTKVFELILRLKGNFLWPAMWNNSFDTDDPLNPKLADEYGIVMSTSHHEPMMRAWKEWGRAGHKPGSWDYSKNPQALREFWAEGIRRTKDYEKIITLAMRGDGDEPMSEDENIALLEKIVRDQRSIIADRIDKDLSDIPQVWALYKEVQGYYEKGMRVPDDVILLWCDDNWGNIRRLPTAAERQRSGGAGIYYHFDYVGGPRSYRWINTNPIPKIWEQMNLAYRYDANKIWVVNVGDLKPMEFPIEFFLTLAWDPDHWPKERLDAYTRLWAERQFGPADADDIADIISKYAKYNGRRKPELLATDTYSLIHYNEAERVEADFRAIVSKAESIYQKLPTEAKDAFFQLVLHPAKASAIVNELYITAGKNRLYADQRRAATNETADRVRRLFKADAALSDQYHTIADGKWNHMMDQTHIGYTNWNNPPRNVIPEVDTLDLPQAADMGIAVDGSAQSWPGPEQSPNLPEFSVFTQVSHPIDIFNKGRQPFDYTVTADQPWIQLSSTNGQVDQQTRIHVSVNWDRAPQGVAGGTITIAGTGKDVTVKVTAVNPAVPSRERLDGFVEANGFVAIEPAHYTNKIDTESASWQEIPGYGRTLSGMSVFPVTADSILPPQETPRLEYKMFLFNPASVTVQTVVGPTLNFVPDRALRVAVSFDDQPPQVLEIVPKGYTAENGNRDWETAVSRNARILKSTHLLSAGGYHTLKIRMVDPGVVLQRLIVDVGGLKPSYLGPPESYHNMSETGLRQGRR